MGEIRAMTRAEVDLAVEWAAREGWNPGLADAACFHAADPEGFLIAEVDGEPAGTISIVRYGAFAFLGLFIVRPELRGQGIGGRLWRAATGRAEDGTIGLDGVVARQASYARSGFAAAHRNVRYGGSVAVEPASPDAGISTVGSDRVAAIAAYDRALFPAAREAFLRCWLRPERRALVLIEDQAVAGFGVIRACRAGFKIGPLFADREAGADALFRALAAAAGGAPIYLDVPEPNTAAVRLAARYGLAPVFETARMYRGPAPALPLHRIFGITTLELG